MLIVEDSPSRQEILTRLYKDHAWVIAHTADRAIRLLKVFQFDLVSLDFDLGGPGKGDAVAAIIPASRSAGAKVIVHSMNARGAALISRLLPGADLVPLTRFTKSNATFRRLRQEVNAGVNIDWTFVLRGRRTTSIAGETGHQTA